MEQTTHPEILSHPNMQIPQSKTELEEKLWGYLKFFLLNQNQDPAEIQKFVQNPQNLQEIGLNSSVIESFKMVVQNLGSISKQICERELTECANDYSFSQSDQEDDYPFNDQEPEHILRRDTHLNDCQMFKPKLIPMEIDAEDYEIE